MRYLLPSLLLACLPATAAEWTQLPLPASSLAAVYQEPATERSRHNRFVGTFVRNPRQSWFLVDYAVPHRWQLYEVRSVKHWLEFDCKDASVRAMSRLYYDGPMAQGRLVASETAARDFSPVVPGEPEEAMLRAACAYLHKEDRLAAAPPTAPVPLPAPAPMAPVPSAVPTPAEPAVQPLPPYPPLEPVRP